MHNKILAVFIPCFNEGERLKIKEFQSFLNFKEIEVDFYFINDGSTDNTVNQIEKIVSRSNNAKLINLNSNLGKGNALREAILNVNLNGYSYISYIDADLDIPLEQIEKLLKTINNSRSKIVLSRRNFYKNWKGAISRNTASIAIMKLANLILKMSPTIKDTQCGCKMFDVSLVTPLFSKKFISSWLFDIEILLRFRNFQENARIFIDDVEVTVSTTPDTKKLSFATGIQILLELNEIRKKYK